jgi:very-short-patch-repair endonuclease
MAASLWSAPDGLVSHDTAAVIWGFDGITQRALHVTTPRGRHLRRSDVVVHRVDNLLPVDVATCGPISITSPLRTAVDLAGVVGRAALELAIESALRRGLFSPGQLRWRATGLMGTGRRGSEQLRRLLDERSLGRSESAPEVELARVLERGGLGAPIRQFPVRVNGRLVARVDLAYPDARVAIEYDSDAWHSGVARRHKDAERRNRLRALGWTVVEITSAMLRAPDALVGLVRGLLANHGSAQGAG